jgi:hypothetical protein
MKNERTTFTPGQLRDFASNDLAPWHLPVGFCVRLLCAFAVYFRVAAVRTRSQNPIYFNVTGNLR